MTMTIEKSASVKASHFNCSCRCVEEINIFLPTVASTIKRALFNQAWQMPRVSLAGKEERSEKRKRFFVAYFSKTYKSQKKKTIIIISRCVCLCLARDFFALSLRRAEKEGKLTNSFFSFIHPEHLRSSGRRKMKITWINTHTHTQYD